MAKRLHLRRLETNYCHTIAIPLPSACCRLERMSQVPVLIVGAGHAGFQVAASLRAAVAMAGVSA